MALSYVEYTADGVDTQFTVNFNFISRSHVTVTIDGVDDATFTWINDGLIEPTDTPANLEKVRITRSTPTNPTSQTDFEDGSTLVEEDLDRVLKQAMYVAEESNDAATDSLGISSDDAGAWDALTKRIKNVVDAVGAQDAVSKSQLDAVVAAAGNVPTPADPGGGGKYLKADSGTHAWTDFLIAHISDAVAVVRTFLGSADKAAMRTNMGVVIGTDVLAPSGDGTSLTGIQADLAVPSQAEAEAGTATSERVWTAQRIKQAIAALPTVQGWKKLSQTVVASDVSSVDIESGIDGTYDNYVIIVSGLIPETNDTELEMRVKVASAYKSGSTDYSSAVVVGTSHEFVTSAGADNMTLGNGNGGRGLGSAAGETLNLQVHFSSPAETANFKQFSFLGAYMSGDGRSSPMMGSGAYDGGTEAIVGVQFLMNADKITAGIFTLYGVVK